MSIDALFSQSNLQTPQQRNDVMYDAHHSFEYGTLYLVRCKYSNVFLYGSAYHTALWLDSIKKLNFVNLSFL
jgi:hypothetical protein